jgi:hypothetical protein
MAQSPNLRVKRIPADELSDQQIERLMTFGQQEAALIEELEQATRSGDRDLVWQIAQALCGIQDQINEECRK